MNKVILIGTVYTEPKSRDIENGHITRFSMKVEKESGKGYDVLVIEHYDLLPNEIQKGCSIVVWGELRHNQWTTNEGIKKDEYVIKTTSAPIFLSGA